MGSETLSSGERFALVHSSIPFALGRAHIKVSRILDSVNYYDRIATWVTIRLI
ncbi:hypothetical protein LEP1GSC041_3144 [Leptospira noguchii str. 2006001870]|nr:hypothetical protein LEP1GSC041_3144 [Leptospira noguchii str. 2006001870]